MRGAPKKDPREVKKNHGWKVSDKNHAKIKILAEETGLSVNAYLTAKALNKLK